MCSRMLCSLQLHGNPLPAELMRDGRGPEVSHQDGVLRWVNTGLTTDELQQRLLALTDAQCAAVTQCVALWCCVWLALLMGGVAQAVL